MKWRDDHGRQRSETLPRKADAEAYEAKIRLAKRRGELDDIDKGRTTFGVMMDRWWETDAKHRLAAKTLASYKVIRDKYLLPAFETTELRKIKPERVQRFKADLIEKGVGDATVRKALMLLQSVLGQAELFGYISSNPVRAVKKPKQARNTEPVTLPPAGVELLRSKLLEIGLLPDATLVSLLAYSGVRPGEALALTWGDIAAKSIRVTKASSNGAIKETKTGRTRTVMLLAPLRADLDDWREHCGNTEPGALVFAKRMGTPWKDHDWKNWSTRHFDPAAKKAGYPGLTPYSLRHSFASLLFQEQRNPAEIAEQLGHSLQMLFSTYAHVITELRGQRRVRAVTLIEKARKAQSPVPKMFPQTVST